MALCRDSCLLISAFIAAELTDLLLLFILTHGFVDLKQSASAHLNSTDWRQQQKKKKKKVAAAAAAQGVSLSL